MAPTLTHVHTIGESDDICTRLLGALSFTVVWGVGQFVGPLSLPLLAWAAFYLPWAVTAVIAAFMLYPFCVPPESLYSPRFCRFVLSQAGWLKGGSSMWVSEDVLHLKDRVNEGIMVAYHPHGLIPCGFALNGAVRARAQKNEVYVPPWLPLNATVSGVQAPVLFKIPLLRHILLGFGCCVPATKAGVRRLLTKRTTFGIIPGGSEEVAIHQTGKENIYLKVGNHHGSLGRFYLPRGPPLGPRMYTPPTHACSLGRGKSPIPKGRKEWAVNDQCASESRSQKRAGFLKYALQHGYTIVIAFTFGESDLYSSVAAVRPINLWLVKKFGFVLPILTHRVETP